MWENNTRALNKQSEEDKGFRAYHRNSYSVAHGHELNEFVTEEREASSTFSHKRECDL